MRKKMNIEVGTIARTVVLVAVLVNQVLTLTGKNPLPFADEEVYSAVTAVITVGAALAAWWKNNSFTQAAIESDTYLKRLKK